MVVVDPREPPYYAVMVKGDAEIGPGLSRDEEYELVRRYLGEDRVDAYLAQYEKRRANVASIIIRVPPRSSSSVADAGPRGLRRRFRGFRRRRATSASGGFHRIEVSTMLSKRSVADRVRSAASHFSTA